MQDLWQKPATQLSLFQEKHPQKSQTETQNHLNLFLSPNMCEMQLSCKQCSSDLQVNEASENDK